MMNSARHLVKHFLSKSYDTQSLLLLHVINSFNYEYSAYVIASGQFVLNLTVIGIVLLNKFTKKQQRNQYVFAFILNLAFSDLVGFAINITDVVVEKWIFPEDYFLHDPESFGRRMTRGCIIQSAILEFAYVQSLLATSFLTLERYLLIAKPFDYDKVSELY